VSWHPSLGDGDSAGGAAAPRSRPAGGGV